LRQVQVVVLRAAPAADHLELEPDHAARAVPVRDDAALDVELVELLLHLGDGPERLHQQAVGLGPERGVVHPDLLQHALAVVDPAVDLHHVEALLQQPDRGQEIFPLQPVLVELLGRVVGRHAIDHSELHRALEQPADDHRVGDVVDLHLVEADQAVALGDARRERVERILAALQLLQLPVHVAHEMVEVHPALAHERQRQEEAVHEKALAAADPAPEVDAARERRVHHEPPQSVAAPRLVRRPLLVEPLQALDRALLRRVAREAALAERPAVDLERRELLALGDPRSSRIRTAVAHHMLSGRLSTASAASCITSESDGCACTTRAMSSELARNSIATTASAISSEAWVLMTCTPRISSVFACASIFTNPCVSPCPSARPLAENGNWPARYGVPSALSCCSVLP